MSDYALFFTHNNGGVSCWVDLTLEQAQRLSRYWSGYPVRHPDWVKIQIVKENTMETIETRELV
jgi:hypothetical protein